MRILVINPNATSAMTDDMVRSARAVEPDAEIFGATAGHGLPSLEGYRDDVVAAGAVVDLISAHEGSFDAAIVGCFGDPGLFAARELTEAPVVGLAESSFLTALPLGHRFSVLTTLERGAPPILDVIRLHGVEGRCASVRSTGLTVLEAHGDADAAAAALEREGRLAIELDRAEVLCLGCGGMVGLRERLEDNLGVPVIEAISAATALAGALVRNGLRTSKVRAFKWPEPTVVS
ncbi:MAG TPA: aspartate/glutamate racemase family protein [Solirubrobacteraceae bacterium]|jgi:allantoin racemase|nr:aspartate/glutamate racemase family protein [Solirubrobacteraceae bacterium]